MTPRAPALLACAAALFAGTAAAGGFRAINPVPAPANLPAGARLVEVVPVDPRAVQEAARQWAESWNAPGGAAVDVAIHDSERLADAMATGVPRDARLVLESVRSIQTLQQAVVEDRTYGRLRISTVAATLATRLQFNDAAQGFVNVPGVNEVQLEITEQIR